MFSIIIEWRNVYVRFTFKGFCVILSLLLVNNNFFVLLKLAHTEIGALIF